MKSFFVSACLLIFCAGSFAQSAPQSTDPDAQALIAKSRALLEAEKTKDVAVLNNLLSEDFRSIDVAGDFSSRKEMLGSAQEGFVKDFLFYEPQALRIDNDSVLVSYNTAITLSDAVIQELAEDNLTWPRYSKISDLWVRQDGDWKLKFEQVTPVRAMY
ncbi:MAG TPA: nuclear transport factor 2 family protein [Terriglobales bacterium]|nr:nuclear transport factor 2 family protein [Terriglobales bacterium]